VKLALLLLASGLTLGCSPNLWLSTPAPPMTSLVFDPPRDSIEITQGVAAGFEVWCPFTSCLDIQAVTDAPGVAEVHRAHLAALQHSWTSHNTPALVLVGIGPGRTMLHVSQQGHAHDFWVTVLPPTPAAPPPR
jgi:hypothetical protein